MATTTKQLPDDRVSRGRPASGGTRKKKKGAGEKIKGGMIHASTSHTRPADRPRPHRHGQSVRGAATAAPLLLRSRSRSGSASSSIARPSRRQKQAARHATQVCQPPGRTRPLRISTRRRRGGLDKALFAKLATGDWIGQRQDRPDHRQNRHGARAGLPARSHTRHAVTIDRCSTIACHACSTHLPWHAAMDGIYASSRASPVVRASDPRRLGAGAADLAAGPRPCSKSSMIDTAAARRS